MEAMRQSWTDDRLDDLTKQVDRRFEQVDRRFADMARRDEVQAEFAEVGRRFDALEGRLDSFYRVLVLASVSMIAALVATNAG